jgi:hypothetical protein
MVAESEKDQEVRRILDRYLVEIVEEYNFCPWAHAARTGGEVSPVVLFGQPNLDQWLDAARTALGRTKNARVAMVVAPELAATTTEFRSIREQIARRIEFAGVADFHPDGTFDTASPARLVPFVRRSPDPLLQLVPLEILHGVRTQTAPPTLSEQARALGGVAHTGSEDIADRIAATNHSRVRKDLARIEEVLDDIAADRRRSYARAGIAINTSR